MRFLTKKIPGIKKRRAKIRSGKNLILINAKKPYVRIAQLREGALFNFHIENSLRPFKVASVFKAKVIKKHLSLDACFVNIGTQRPAFFYTGRKVYKKPDRVNLADKDFFEENLEENKALKSDKDNLLKKLKIGQYIMVQVLKDPLKSKGLRVSDKISLPGHYLVYLPNSPLHIGVSRQIEDESLREELLNRVEKWSEESALIIRTKALEASEEELKQDFKSLQNTWEKIQSKYKAQKKPGLIWSDMSFSCKILRDFLTEDVEKVLVDEEQIFLDLKTFISETMPQHEKKISFYNNKNRALFDKYDLEPTLDRLLNKKIKLKSGGSIVIEETEAAVVIDVNTGSFMEKKIPEENILKINKEAAKEISLQLRLRNLGGIIIIDFIDMETESSREKVMEVLSQELKKDRVPTQLFNMSELAIVEITRKRVHSSLLEIMCEPCFHCGGRGWLKK